MELFVLGARQPTFEITSLLFILSVHRQLKLPQILIKIILTHSHLLLLLSGLIDRIEFLLTITLLQYGMSNDFINRCCWLMLIFSLNGAGKLGGLRLILISIGIDTFQFRLFNRLINILHRNKMLFI